MKIFTFGMSYVHNGNETFDIVVQCFINQYFNFVEIECTETRTRRDIDVDKVFYKRQ